MKNPPKANLGIMIALGAAGGVGGMILSRMVKGTSLQGPFFALIGLVLIAFIGYVVWMLVVKNKSVSKATPEQQSQALKFLPVPGRAVVYLYRKQYVGMLMGMDVVLNGQLIGQTRGYCFYRLELAPGHYTLSGDKKCVGELSFEAKDGQAIYIEKEITMGAMSGGYRYVLTNNIAQAQEKIRGCKLYLQNALPS
jgi:TM2 domain-containing membrane protein YozV